MKQPSQLHVKIRTNGEQGAVPRPQTEANLILNEGTDETQIINIKKPSACTNR
jgi:hypothetical protein